MNDTIKKLLFIIVLFASHSCSEEGTHETEVPELPEISLESSTRQLIVTDQHDNTIRIYDQPTRTLLWKWSAADSDIPSNRQSWFALPDECKPVLNCDCILMTASRGGVALIDINTGKALFYAHPAKNPHSAEILPDGNIVVASSDGFLSLYRNNPETPYADNYIARYEFAGAHNVVWDAKRNCLWTCGDSEMRRYSYDGKSLSLVSSISLPAQWAHDLVPYRDQDILVMTTGSTVNFFDPETQSFTTARCFKQTDIKSVSFGDIAICTTPTESWWTPEVLNFNTGERVFFNAEMQIYKARWRVDNSFSYPKQSE